MNYKTEYLTEEELELLIAEVEQDDIVAAPPDLLDNVVTALFEEPVSVKRKRRKREYYAYCFRVITSVAAAIVLVFLLPSIGQDMSGEAPVREVQVTEGRYETKEDAMAAAGLLTGKLSGRNWFDNVNRWNIIEKINGGFENETEKEE